MSDSPLSDSFFSASSSQATAPSPESPLSDASVSSEQLYRLLESLHVSGRLPGGRRLVLSDSESDGGSPAPRCSPRGHSSMGASGQGTPAIPTARRLDGSSSLAALPAGHGQGGPDFLTPMGRPAAAQSRPGDAQDCGVDVVDLLSSSSSSSDLETWSVTRPTTRRKRQVIDSDADDSDLSPNPKGARSGPEDSSPSPRSRRALPAFFASIGPLQSIQLNSPAKPNQLSSPAKPTSVRKLQPKTAAADASAAEPRPPPAVLSPQRPARCSAAKPAQSAAAFKRQREQLTRQLYEEYNRRIFDGRLPADLEIKWNNRLSSTAGLTHYRREIPPELHEAPRYSAHVELSAKVLDAQPKLERTLCHELCHVAAWLLDHTAKPPHGPMFKKWADRAMRVLPHLDITTCHSYEIFYAYRWQCSNNGCGQTYGRHSNSIDTAKKVCGECKSQLVYLGRFQSDGTPAKPRGPTAFSQFVKDGYTAAKEEAPHGTPHADIMKALATKWAAKQQQGPGGETAATAAAGVGRGRAGRGSNIISLLDGLTV